MIEGTTAIINHLAKARNEKQWTSEKVARKLGYDRKAVWGWETLRHTPSLTAAADWANTLGYKIVLVPIGESR